ncbi:MAG TPA: SRPBCC family protein [Gemmatimonadaceae bacterium]|nr:SRPBCC family protein [Gemmatimonadaceae bacterium]
MRQYKREIFIGRSRDVVFDYFADMNNITAWAPEEFVSVSRVSDGPIALGSRFEFVTKGAGVRPVFTWDTFDSPVSLTFSGPRLNVGPGWIRGTGGYAFRDAPGGTVVTAWFKPTLGGLLALMSPFARMRNVRLLGKQLARAKALIESG